MNVTGGVGQGGFALLGAQAGGDFTGNILFAEVDRNFQVAAGITYNTFAQVGPMSRGAIMGDITFKFCE